MLKALKHEFLSELCKTKHVRKKMCLHYKARLVDIFSEIIAFYSENRTKSVNIFWRQSLQSFNVEVATYIYHYNLKS
jgi:hypothetical protein